MKIKIIKHRQETKHLCGLTTVREHYTIASRARFWPFWSTHRWYYPEGDEIAIFDTKEEAEKEVKATRNRKKKWKK